MEGGRRIVFFPFVRKGEKQHDPDHPVNPVKKKPLAEKTIEDVLLHFGDTIKVARRRYRQFVKEGVDQGSRVNAGRCAERGKKSCFPA